MSEHWWVRGKGEIIDSLHEIHPETIVSLSTCSEVGKTKLWLACLLPGIGSPSNLTLPQTSTWSVFNNTLNEILKLSKVYSIKCQFINFAPSKPPPVLMFINKKISPRDDFVKYSDISEPPKYISNTEKNN